MAKKKKNQKNNIAKNKNRKGLKEHIKSLLNLNLTRYSRIESYISNLKENIKIKSNLDKRILEELEIQIQDRIKRLKRIFYINIFLYIGIYFSVISFLFTGSSILQQIAVFYKMLFSIFGTTIFFIGIIITNRISELYYQDLTLMGSHIISIYNNNQKNKENVFENNNNYNTFINFFKKRGF